MVGARGGRLPVRIGGYERHAHGAAPRRHPSDRFACCVGSLCFFLQSRSLYWARRLQPRTDEAA
jgi:hypothetical protein